MMSLATAIYTALPTSVRPSVQLQRWLAGNTKVSLHELEVLLAQLDLELLPLHHPRWDPPHRLRVLQGYETFWSVADSETTDDPQLVVKCAQNCTDTIEAQSRSGHLTVPESPHLHKVYLQPVSAFRYRAVWVPTCQITAGDRKGPYKRYVCRNVGACDYAAGRFIARTFNRGIKLLGYQRCACCGGACRIIGEPCMWCGKSPQEQEREQRCHNHVSCAKYRLTAALRNEDMAKVAEIRRWLLAQLSSLG